MKYIYFVSYNYKDHKGGGYGNVEMACNSQYTSIEHIRSCEAAIDAKAPSWAQFKCVVTNYILLRVE